MTHFFSKERSKLDVPLSQGFVADDDPTLVEELLDVTLTKGEAVVEPEGVADDAQGKTMAVRLPVTHGSPAYRA